MTHDGGGRRIIDEHGTRIVIVDSVSLLTQDNQGAVVVGGSHAARQSVAFALKFHPAALLLNDAGKGLDNAGVSGLALMDEQGIPGAAIDCMTARIGDGASMYATGRLSVVNVAAMCLGIRQGMTVQNAIECIISAKGKATDDKQTT